MPKKRSAGKDAGSPPKQLRKRLRKAEDQLQDAQAKRDRAQARVEALSIIADEIRAQLGEAEKAQRAERAAKAERKQAEAASDPAQGDARRASPDRAKPRAPSSADGQELVAAKRQRTTTGRRKAAGAAKPAASGGRPAGKARSSGTGPAPSRAAGTPAPVDPADAATTEGDTASA